MSIGSILIVGAMVLACGCAGLLMVRFDNPRLLGLGWLGAALAAGGAGALLLLLSNLDLPLLFILLADLLVLAAFVLMHVAVREVLTLSGAPSMGLALLGLQALADLYVIFGHGSGHFRLSIIGLLIACQAAQTVYLLRQAEPSIRYPANFIRAILGVFIGCNLLRSFVTAAGLLDHRTAGGRPMSVQVQALTYLLYLAVALGLAFGFFWMTTAGLTAKLEELANTDPLTQALNRRAFTRYIREELLRMARLPASFALLMLDLDHFKEVNDRHGHTAGDEVLCKAVQDMRNATRGVDFVGRWGGEEFAILLPRADQDAAKIVGERIRGNIERSLPLPDGSMSIPVTASLGIAVWVPGDSVESLIQRADDALYHAKAAGRNCVVVAKPLENETAQIAVTLAHTSHA